MIIDAQVTRVEEARKGISVQGIPYCRRSIVIAFAEEASDKQVINHAITLDLSGQDAERNYAQFQQVRVELRFAVSAYKGRLYQDVRGTILPTQPVQNPSQPMTQNTW